MEVVYYMQHPTNLDQIPDYQRRVYRQAELIDYSVQIMRDIAEQFLDEVATVNARLEVINSICRKGQGIQD